MHGRSEDRDSGQIAIRRVINVIGKRPGDLDSAGLWAGNATVVVADIVSVVTQYQVFCRDLSLVVAVAAVVTVTESQSGCDRIAGINVVPISGDHALRDVEIGAPIAGFDTLMITDEDGIGDFNEVLITAGDSVVISTFDPGAFNREICTVVIQTIIFRVNHITVCKSRWSA